MLIPIWLLHRHPALWAQPDLFDPRRWLDDAPEPDRACYIPFGLGPHVCIGAQLAMAEATLALAALTRRLRLTRTDTAAIHPYGVLSLRPDRTVMMRADV